MSILKWTAKPSTWIVLFVFLCQLVLASPELMILGMALAGLVLLFRNPNQTHTAILPKSRKFWFVPLIFASIFGAKLLSAAWGLDPRQSIDNAFNSIHFLLWPALFVYFRNANISVRQTEPWAAASMFVLVVWYFSSRLFFPFSRNAHCFEAGAHDCGLLGQSMAFMLLWLFIAVTRPVSKKSEKFYLVAALSAGWLAFLGTERRTEMLGLILGMGAVLFWRFKQNLTLKYKMIACGLCTVFLITAWPVMKPRFDVVKEEAILYLEGGSARTQVLHTNIGSRLEMYRMALLAIQERPWLGWGAGLKPKHISQFATDPSNPYGYSNFHQQYLQVVLEIGVLGGLLALAMLIYLCRVMIMIPWQGGNRELVAILAALFFTYAWKGLANGALGYSMTNSVFVFFSALIWAELTKPVIGPSTQ